MRTSSHPHLEATTPFDITPSLALSVAGTRLPSSYAFEDTCHSTTLRMSAIQGFVDKEVQVVLYDGRIIVVSSGLGGLYRGCC